MQRAPIGIPFLKVPGTQTKYHAGESDAGPYALPLNAPIEDSVPVTVTNPDAQVPTRFPLRSIRVGRFP
jgi:hypothetical protein